MRVPEVNFNVVQGDDKLHNATKKNNLKFSRVLMVDCCCIFHAENDAVDRFSLSPHIVESWFLCNQMDTLEYSNRILIDWCSIWLHRNQNSTIWGDSEKRSTASFSVWKIQQESTIRTLENKFFFCCVGLFLCGGAISVGTGSEDLELQESSRWGLGNYSDLAKWGRVLNLVSEKSLNGVWKARCGIRVVWATNGLNC